MASYCLYFNPGNMQRQMPKRDDENEHARNVESGYNGRMKSHAKKPFPAASLQAAVEQSTVLECHVVQAKACGLDVFIDGVKAFMPKSQVELARSVELKQYLGQKLRCRVLSLDTDRKSVVVGRRSVLQEEKLVGLLNLHIGNVCTGIITGIESFGVFVDFKGIDGLVLKKHLSWGFCRNPEEHFQIGQAVRFNILGIDAAHLRFEASIRDAGPNPWMEVGQWSVGKQMVGKVSSKVDYGVFVTLPVGIEALLHGSCMANKTSLEIGEAINVRIIALDPDAQRVSLELA